MPAAITHARAAAKPSRRRSGSPRGCAGRSPGDREDHGDDQQQADESQLAEHLGVSDGPSRASPGSGRCRCPGELVGARSRSAQRRALELAVGDAPVRDPAVGARVGQARTLVGARCGGDCSTRRTGRIGAAGQRRRRRPPARARRRRRRRSTPVAVRAPSGCMPRRSVRAEHSVRSSAAPLHAQCDDERQRLSLIAGRARERIVGDEQIGAVGEGDRDDRRRPARGRGPLISARG